MHALTRLLRDPLIQLLLAGAVIYALYAFAAPRPATDVVQLSRADVEALAADWTARMGAPPSAPQLLEHVYKHVEQEVLYREALSLGLEVDDLVVKRRLAQKMQFLLEFTEPVAAADEAAMQAWLAADPGRFERPARVDLVHAFISGDRAGVDVLSAIAALRADLADRAPVPGEVLPGDRFVGGHELRGQTRARLVQRFGEAFADAAMSLTPQRWSTPVKTAFGSHLLWVIRREAPAQPPLAEIRERVAEQMRRDAQAEATAAAMRDLWARYEVSVDYPPLAPELARRFGTVPGGEALKANP